MPFKVMGREIGRYHPPFIIAEISCNHQNDLGKAFRIMEAAKSAGADAVKLQTYTADTITFNGSGDEFKVKGGLWDGRTLHDLYDEAHTPWEWHRDLFDKAKELNLTCFSSPFDLTAVDFLEDNFYPPAYKIASFEMIDIPLIQKVAGLGKPMFMSTGLASENEIEEAVLAAKEAGCEELLLFHCVSGYPTKLSDANVAMMRGLQEKYDVEVGLSDHTLSLAPSLSATALGAAAIEKHFVLSRKDGSLDAEFSLEPGELKSLVEETKAVFMSLGSSTRKSIDSEKASRGLRRSLYIVKDVKKGEHFTKENVKSIRPENGMHTRNYPKVLNCKATCDIEAGTPLKEIHLDDKTFLSTSKS